MKKRILSHFLLSAIGIEHTLQEKNTVDELKGIDIKKEAQLIKQKKSKLSKRLRGKVMNYIEYGGQNENGRICR